MNTIKKEKQISFTERKYIEYLRNVEKRSIGTTAKILQRAKSTVSKELQRVYGTYDARKAQGHRDRAQYHKTKDWMKIVEHRELRTYVETHMKEDWSPEEIAGRLKHIDTKLPIVSTPSIYRFIYSVYGRCIEKYLRYGKRSKYAKGYAHKVTIDGRTFIDKRPKRVASRRWFGDWEADFICSGKSGKGYLLVFVERKTRYIIVKRILTKDIETMHKIFREVLGVTYIVNSLTIDNDIVFRRHAELSSIVGAPVFFTHPYHSWEKGTVENMNKWIRQYVKKGSDISKYTDAYVQTIEDKLNGRPRKCLKYKTPLEALKGEKHVLKEVYLIHSRILAV
jgi:transposase, IS30 family